MSDIVERLRAENSVVLAFGHDLSDLLLAAADEIERLRAERDQAKEVRSVAIREMAAMARDAGGWRGLSEGKDIVIRQLEAERDRLQKALDGVMNSHGEQLHDAFAEARAALKETGHE